jgi:hypothetical protein
VNPEESKQLARAAYCPSTAAPTQEMSVLPVPERWYDRIVVALQSELLAELQLKGALDKKPVVLRIRI